MPDVQFQDENNLPQQRDLGAPGLYGVTVKLGLAKNEKEAGTILVAIAVAAAILAVAAPFVIGSSTKYTHPSNEQIQKAMVLPPH